MIRLSALLLSVAALTGILAPPAPGALPSDFADQPVIENLSSPAAFDFLPDGRVLIVEQDSANIRLVSADTLVATPALHVPDVNTSGGERGLLGLAVDPAWPTRPYAYLMFNRTPGNMMTIARFTGSGQLSDAQSPDLTFGSRYDILVDIPDNASNHNAGTLRFGPDGMLYASLGDDAAACTAQDSSDFRGVILRMDVAALPSEGSGPADKALITPADNPFPSDDPEAGLAFCFGLRNPFRFHVDPVTGALYIGDVGLGKYEEMNEAWGGENFGWPHREGPVVRVQSGCPEPGGSGSQVYDGPIGGYDRSAFSPAAIIAGPRYRSVVAGPYSFPPLYNGAVFFSEYYQGFVRVLKENAGTWAPLDPVPGQPSPENWADGLSFVSDWGTGPDGALYYLQQASGSLRRIVYTGSRLGLDPADGRVRPAPWPNPFRAGGGPLTLRLPEGEGPLEVQVLSIRGRKVRTLYSERAGDGNLIRWDGRDDAGRDLSAGVYLMRLQYSGKTVAVRVALLR